MPDAFQMDQFQLQNFQYAFFFDAHFHSHPVSVSVSDPHEIDSIFDDVVYYKVSAPLSGRRTPEQMIFSLSTGFFTDPDVGERDRTGSDETRAAPLPPPLSVPQRGELRPVGRSVRGELAWAAGK